MGYARVSGCLLPDYEDPRNWTVAGSTGKVLRAIVGHGTGHSAEN